MKSNHYFCYFIVLSIKYVFSLLQLHFRIKYFEENHISSRLLYILLSPKFINEVRWELQVFKYWNPAIIPVQYLSKDFAW